jgi:hypothetical protein
VHTGNDNFPKTLTVNPYFSPLTGLKLWISLVKDRIKQPC